MRFMDFPYQRINMEKFEKEFNSAINDFINANNFNEHDAAMQKINRLRNNFSTMSTIVYARHTIDTTDEFYKKEQDFYSQNSPVCDELVSKYYQCLIDSKFRTELENKWGKQLFTIAEHAIRTFSPEIVEDLQLEKKLANDYIRLMASMKVVFEGQEKPFYQLILLVQSSDRDMRKGASNALFNSFLEKQSNFDELFDNLIKVRTKIAHKLGYKNFVELGYKRLDRSDYTPEMVSNFRKQIQDYIVPIITKLRKRQRKRLGLESLKVYDENFTFKSGSPKPKGSPEWIVENGLKMYSELSHETSELFSYLVESDLMDLVSKNGKAGGGYCTFFRNFKVPFIFSNFNGTSEDIRVLTHEAGHAFQKYCSKDFEIPEYYYPTTEACEIHSMAMEFFTSPWMNLFFLEDTDKFRFNHLCEALYAMPYHAAIDEFQHFAYENYNATPAERRQAWKDIEKKYIPSRDTDGNEFFESGGAWHMQEHPFTDPFYYIDYSLARVCAFQFWKKMTEDKESAWKSYIKLCKAGGSKSFLELVKIADLISPFEDGCVESVIGTIEEFLDKVDDSNM